MANLRWTGDDHANLHQRTVEELEFIYYEFSKNHLRALKNYHINKGCTVERQEPYLNPENEREKVASKRRRVAPKLGNVIMTTIEIPVEHIGYYDQLTQALLEGPVGSATFTSREGSHQSFIKNGNNEIEYTQDMPNHRNETRYTVKFNTEFNEMLAAVSKLKPVEIKLPRRSKEVKLPEEYEKSVFCSDPHFGFLRMPDGELIPTHDDEALSIFLQVARDAKVSKIIIGSDGMDNPTFSNFDQYNQYVDTLQPTANRVAEFIQSCLCITPNVIWIDGNHDNRPRKAGNRLMAEFANFKRPGEKYPLLSIPGMLGFEKLGIDYYPFAPDMKVQINNRLSIKHGKGSKLQFARDFTSTIQGDGHRTDRLPEVVQTPFGVREVHKYMSGVMGRVDGPIPSQISAFDTNSRPIGAVNNWIQSFTMIESKPGDQPFNITEVRTNPHDGYIARFNGKTYRP